MELGFIIKGILSHYEKMGRDAHPMVVRLTDFAIFAYLCSPGSYEGNGGPVAQSERADDLGPNRGSHGSGTKFIPKWPTYQERWSRAHSR